jgi:creatinine amidohydrolase/Fe(II)-dependent formamide hydrolase-like protein
MRVHDLNWMQLEDCLSRDDRIVLPIGSTEQHAYLSLGTDCILAERVSVEAAEPLGVPVLPVLPYGLTPLEPGLRADPDRQRPRREHARSLGRLAVGRAPS